MGPDVNPSLPAKAPPNFVPTANSCANCGALEADGDSPVAVAFDTPGIAASGCTHALLRPAKRSRTISIGARMPTEPS